MVTEQEYNDAAEKQDYITYVLSQMTGELRKLVESPNNPMLMNAIAVEDAVSGINETIGDLFAKEERANLRIMHEYEQQEARAAKREHSTYHTSNGAA